MNGIVKNAREVNMNNSNTSTKILNMANRAQLTPIKVDAYEKGKESNANGN